MNLSIHGSIWKWALLFCAGVTLLPEAHAQSPWLFDQWRESFSLPAGSYASDKKIEVSEGISVTISPGCWIEKAWLLGKQHNKWKLSGSLLRKVYIAGDMGTRLEARDCAFDGCGIGKNGRWFVDLWSTRWRYENCVFADTLFPGEMGLTDYGVVAERCTFYKLTLPKLRYKHDPAKEAQSENLRFVNCRFVNCEVPESFLAATQDCVFEDCQFGKRGTWEKAKSPITVNAFTTGRAKPPESYTNGMLTVTFKAAGTQLAGATLPHTYRDGKISPPAPKPAAQPVVLGSVAAPPKVSEPGSPEPKPAPTAAAIPVVPSAPAGAAVAEFIRQNRQNLVFVSNATGAGSGFIASMDGANYLVTNAHVAASARGATYKTLDDAQVQFGAASVAVGADAFRMALPAGGKPLEIMAGVDEGAGIDDEVVVLGNAQGAGVVNAIKGKIVGIGPQLVEVDAPFQPGNSGSPIIHVPTGKVLGVATYLTINQLDPATKQPVKQPVVRRFGYRLDSVKTWQPANWQAFFAQAAEMDAIEKLTAALIEFLRDLAADARVNSGIHSHPQIKGRIDSWLATKSRRLSPADRTAADQNLLAFLKVTCTSDVRAAQGRMSYDYFQRQLATEIREREQLSGIFEKIIRELQTAR